MPKTIRKNFKQVPDTETSSILTFDIEKSSESNDCDDEVATAIDGDCDDDEILSDITMPYTYFCFFLYIF